MPQTRCPGTPGVQTELGRPPESDRTNASPSRVDLL